MDLIHVIYTSVATVTFSKEDLHHLLHQARVNNASISVTGMLLFDQGTFFQVLEGPADQVQSLYKCIEQDPRHQDVVVIVKEPIQGRSFADWTMGYAEVSAEDLAEIIGLNGCFDKGASFSGVEQGRAQQLLKAFRDGRWLSRLCNEGIGKGV